MNEQEMYLNEELNRLNHSGETEMAEREKTVI
jgi:hypothetical protein